MLRIKDKDFVLDRHPQARIVKDGEYHRLQAGPAAPMQQPKAFPWMCWAVARRAIELREAGVV